MIVWREKLARSMVTDLGWLYSVVSNWGKGAARVFGSCNIQSLAAGYLLGPVAPYGREVPQWGLQLGRPCWLGMNA